MITGSDLLGTEHLVSALFNPILRKEYNEDILTSLNGSGIREEIAQLLAARGGGSADELLNPQCHKSYRPYNEFERFQRLIQSINGQKVCVVYDYDVDGVTAAAQFIRFLQILGSNILALTPRRVADGYGVKEWMVQKAADQGCRYLFSLDCGTQDLGVFSYASQLGIIGAVIDHHLVLEEKTPENLFSNPERCASGFVHDLVCAYLESEGLLDYGFYRESLMFAALGTVADVVPLTAANRALVYQGLTEINETEHQGVRALIRKAGIRSEISSHEVAFQIAPRLNAPGRVDEINGAALSLKLLLCEGNPEELATQIEGFQLKRREIESNGVRLALEEAKLQKQNTGIVLYHQEFHLGVVGLIASRLCEKFRVPVVILGDAEEGVVKGSLRSPPGVSGIELLISTSQCLLGFGGHERAGGVILKKENVERFTKMFSLASIGKNPDNRIFYDLELGIKDISEELLRALSSIGPFGEGFREPVVLFREVTILGTRETKTASFINATDKTGEIEFRGYPNSVIVGKNYDFAAKVLHKKIEGKEYFSLQLVGIKEL